MYGRSEAGWSTPEMDQAERELDARIDYAMGVATDVQAKTEQLEQWIEAQEPPSDEDVERMKSFILGHAHTDEWKRVIDRINRGELTWRQVVEGLASGKLDHGVADAFESLTRVPPASMEKLVEIYGPAQSPEDAPADDKADDRPGQHRAPDGHDDEEWYGDPLGRRR